ncbi:MAG: cation:proton antiporter [Nanoarchaeota archaeon]
MDVTLILLGVGLILIFGYLAEFMFKKFGIPDVLFLLILGFAMGPHIFSVLHPSSVGFIAPLFTTFALLFLLFDGAFNIDLASFAKGIASALLFTLYNFFISVVIVSGIMVTFGYDLLISLLFGFILGGISSAFVIPVIQQMKIKGETYSILTLESALTDVFCIVSSLTVIQIIMTQAFSAKAVITTITSLFAIAGAIGIIGGIVWIILVMKIFKDKRSYMMTIAFLILLFVLTEYLGGTGALAALFFGIILRNSRQLTSILKAILSRKKYDGSKINPIKGDLGFDATTKSEQEFYRQISFLLKTFFFVYIGILLDISDYRAVILGILLSISIILVRNTSRFVSRGFDDFSRSLIAIMGGRGLAAAALAIIAIEVAIPGAQFLGKVVYVTIFLTILLSSVRLFLLKRSLPKEIRNTIIAEK